jgi:hypothetical protein
MQQTRPIRHNWTSCGMRLKKRGRRERKLGSNLKHLSLDVPNIQIALTRVSESIDAHTQVVTRYVDLLTERSMKFGND